VEIAANRAGINGGANEHAAKTITVTVTDLNDEYRINVTQFRTTIHRYKKNVLSENKILYFRVKVKKCYYLNLFS
jgi:predicted component of type VI protein secretion system